MLELYGGVGTIGFHLLDKVTKIRCSDENPNNENCFADTKSKLPKELADRIKYKTGDAAHQISNVQRTNLMIVDPPRKGLGDKVMHMLEGLKEKKIGPTRLIYISCGFKAFKRDCEKLVKANWTLVHAEVHVLFPGSDHIETLAVFDRTVKKEEKREKKRKRTGPSFEELDEMEEKFNAMLGMHDDKKIRQKSNTQDDKNSAEGQYSRRQENSAEEQHSR